MSDIFFIDWELWQQMSFCLAVMIFIVMIAGVIRLQYLTWKSKKIILEDEEKKARISEVRNTGLRVRRDKDIPFGVRAIESGIEVDGIWISRPTTPATQNEKLFTSSMTTLTTEDAPNKGKEVEVSDLIDTSSPKTSPRPSPIDHYRPKQPSQLRTGSDSNFPYSKPARDHSPSASSQSNTRVPDSFTASSRTNSLSGIPTMEFTDNTNGMPQPVRAFVPSQYTHGWFATMNSLTSQSRSFLEKTCTYKAKRIFFTLSFWSF